MAGRGKVFLQAKELHETAKTIVGGGGHAFDNIISTMAAAMKDVESAVADMSVRRSALDAGHG